MKLRIPNCRKAIPFKISGFLLLTALFFNITFPVGAQVNNYIFTSSLGTYTPFAGGSVLGTTSNTDNSFNDLSLGFNFVFNGQTYNNVSVNTNGFIAMGSSVTSSYTPISSGPTNNIIAAFGYNINASLFAGSDLRAGTEGTAPNRVFIVQWTSYISPLNDNYNFQIRLYETTNVVEIVYGSFVHSSSVKNIQVGLRGNSTSDFNNRSVTTGQTWAASTPGAVNTATCLLSYSSGDLPEPGLTYRWALPTLDIGATALPSPAGCYGPNQNVVVRVTNLGSGNIDFGATPLTVNASVAGPNPQTFSPAVISNGTLSPGNSLNVTVAAGYDMSAAGTYTFNASTNLAGDQFAGNNNMPAQVKNVTFTPTQPLPLQVNFTGFTGSNLSAVFPGWREATGDSPTGTTSFWLNANAAQQTAFGVNGVTGKINLYLATRKEWLISPKFTATAVSRLRFKTAVTGYNVTSSSIMGFDDKVRVMVSPDCGYSWTPIHEFNRDSMLPETLVPRSIDLSSFAGEDIMVAFFATDGPVDDPEDFDFHLDDIVIESVYPNDVGVTSIPEPENNLCSNANTTLKVVVSNFGSLSQTNIPVRINITGPSSVVLYDTLRTTLAGGSNDTLTLAGAFIPAGGGAYTIQAFTGLLSDNALTNDTLSVIRTFNDNLPPEVSDTTVCGPRSLVLNAAGGGEVTWYDAPSAGNLLSTGSSFTTPLLSSTTTYYVESRTPYDAAIQAGGFAGDRQNFGNMFDITALNTITIDSFDVHIFDTNPNVIKVYYKTGSYVGSETDPAAWTFLDSVEVTGAGFGNPTRAAIGGLTIPAGQTYGLYITTVNGGIRYEALADTTRVSDGNIRLTLGSSNVYPFNGIVFPRGWDGKIYYTAACVSPRNPLVVDIKQVPSAMLNGTQSVCEGDSASLAVIFTGTMPMNITYSDGTSSFSINGISSPSYTFKVPVPSTRTFTLTGVQNATCAGNVSGSATVTVIPLPQVNVSPSAPEICKGGSVLLSATGADSYSWSGPAGFSASGQSASVAPLSTASYAVTGTLNGCQGSSSTVVTVNELPIITLSPASPSVCAGDSVSLNASGASVYQWLPASGLSAGSGSTVMASPASTTTYSVTGTDAKGCSSSSQVTLTVTPLPVVTLSPASASICAGDTAFIAADGADSYTWSPAASFASGSGDFAGATPSVSTTYTVTGLKGSCTDTEEIAITVIPRPAPSVSISADKTILCESTPVTFTASHTDGGSSPVLQWSVNGSPAGTNSTAFVLTNPQHGDVVSCSLTSNLACASPATVASGTISLTVYANPDAANAGPDQVLCPSASVLSANTPSTGSGTWTVLSGGGTVSDPSSPSATVSNLGIGVTLLQWKVTNGNCPASFDTIRITRTAPPEGGSVSGSQTVCTGNSVTLALTNQTPGTAIQWQDSSASNNWQNISNATGLTFSASPLFSTRYRVKVSSPSCPDAFSSPASVIVTPQPVAGTAGSDRSVCTGQSTTLTLTGYTGAIQWQSSGDGIIASDSTGQSSPSLVAQPSGQRYYRARLSATGCPPAFSPWVKVSVNKASAGGYIYSAKSTLCPGTGTTLALRKSAGAIQWQSSADSINFTPLAGTDTLLFVNPGSKTFYRAKTQNATCDPALSGILTIDILPSAVPGTVSAARQVICTGEISSLSLSGYSGNIQWQYSTDNLSWQNITSAASDVYSETPSGSRYYRALVSYGSCAPAPANSVLVNVIPRAYAGILNPLSSTLCPGESVTLNTGSSSGSLQWQSSANGSGGWTNITNATGPSLSITPASAGYYRVIAGNSACSDTSSAIEITVAPAAKAGIITGSDTLCLGNTLTLRLIGYAGSIQWEQSSDNISFAPVAAATSASINVSPPASTFYRTIISNGQCQDTSSSVMVRVVSAQAGTISSGSTVHCTGTASLLTVSGHLGDIQWQISKDNVVFTDISGATSPALTVSPDTTTFYRVKASAIDCRDFSPVFKMDVVPGPVPGVAAVSSSTVCKGSSVSLTLSSFTGNIQWQSSPNGISGWTNMPGETRNPGNAAVSSHSFFRALVTLGSCSAVPSNTVEVSLLPGVTAGIAMADNQRLCQGSAATLHLKNSAGVQSIQWQTGSPAGWNNIPGAASQIYRTGNLQETSRFRAVVSDLTCSDTTAEAVITVDMLPVAGMLEGNGPVCEGSQTVLELKDFSGDIQWQRSYNGVTFDDLTGKTGPLLTVTADRTAIYRARVSTEGSSCPALYSNTYTAVVTARPEAGLVNAVEKVNYGYAAAITLTGYSGTIQWQQSADSTDFSDIAGADKPVLTVYPEQTLFYRAKLHTGDCFEYSNAVKVRLTGPYLRITPVPADEEITLSFHTWQENECSYIIADALGKVWQQGKVQGKIGLNRVKISISSLSSGLYTVKLSGVYDHLGDGKFLKK